MPDYEIKANTVADMMTTLMSLGLAWNTLVGASVKQAVKGDGISNSGVRYTINHYGVKKVGGVAQTGDYSIIRWESTDPFPPVGTTLLAGVVIQPIPTDSPVIFAG